MILGQCENEDKYMAKILYCGREWCPDCGEDWSNMHQRRFARLLPKFMQIEPGYMGYFVIEWPDKYRHNKKRVYSKEALRNTTNVIVDTLAGVRQGRKGRVGGYFDRGVIRWHYFGDKRAGKYNPHANAIVKSAFIPHDKLEEIKKALRDNLDCPDLIVHYHFREKVGQMVHTLKYITRSTFRSESWDPHMADEIYGFRNIRTWGKWDGPAVWNSKGSEYYLTINKMESGKCPGCGGHMTWGKPVDSHMLDAWQAEGKTTSLGGGYFEIDAGVYPGRHKGVDKVAAVNGLTGELVEVDVKDVVRIKTLRGDYDRLAMHVKMAKRRVTFIQDCLRMGIDWHATDIDEDTAS
jgi:hypothetical protein